MFDISLAITCAGFSILIGLGLELYFNKIKRISLSHDKINIDFKLLQNKIENIEKKLSKSDDEIREVQEI